MPKGRTKQTILDAAGRVMLARGAANLTLDAVAAEAGLSKGGLLYHYASKEALLEAMVDRLIAVTEQRIDQHRRRDTAPGGWTRGYLRACLVDDQPATDPTGRLAIALLAAGATDPERIARLGARQADWRRSLADDGIDPVLAQLVRLAADGLWLNDILGIPALDDTERAAVLARLEELSRR
jgi:AcrR family transcriptional regulator